MPLLILVADDDPGIRLSISDYLELSGYSVITAEDGQAALGLVEKYHPHLLVTDIMMPRMDGYELVRQLRQRPTFRLLPVIFLTERASTSERIQGYKLGCDLYLPKPFELEELGAVIRNLLERSQMIQVEWRSFIQGGAAPTQEVEASRLSPPVASVILNLTQREQEVLDQLTKGLSNGDIGNKLHLSPRTVEKHVSSLLRKTETNNRSELVRFAMEHHLVE
ncbi:response regulator transcription factor [Funiculus sociatus GB2-A5]|jgi:DNA-binding NarL/FixJ family response regulator|uniref:Response regulator transcription factor n=1 Tax=Funiculus sociatus GB2-A5 TaxID=2933946 RepID=A0ABV0JMJ8_9CYAN|nr:MULTISPECIES: response regulator transcription factor [unclassified Trichocoleus]MBD1905802.1 response regulator transcription factor [Trichocoleus sp. FACHB-832]MBD2065361.1 response regulator transcription factor [Trichocoleus sp. FACHB-6]